MIYASLPDGVGSAPQILPFYLAMEERIARSFAPGDYFFMWQVNPSVIFGRNQLMENEVNLDFCRRHGIGMFRRKSGGGCVYADMGNVMLSYVTSGGGNVGFTYNKYINLILLALRKIGVEATATGRNDVMIGGKKVSGNAFYRLPGRSIVHGTMLYDTNMEFMLGSITPPAEKLASKGVASVRNHITLLKEHTALSLDAFKAALRETLCGDREIVFTGEDVRETERITRGYLTDEFIFGNNPRCNVTREGRIDGVGGFSVRMELKGDVIKSVDIKGDFFLVGDLEGGILRRLRGVPLVRERLIEALPSDLSDIIMNLSSEDFVRLLTGER